jgi:predicted RNA binding protein YcfA (HicA-like mRNA interferase family)
MPSARAAEFQRAAARLGFRKGRHEGSHERWLHPDGRAATIPIHGGREIGPPLYWKILRQLGVNADEFRELSR